MADTEQPTPLDTPAAMLNALFSKLAREGPDISAILAEAQQRQPALSTILAEAWQRQPALYELLAPVPPPATDDAPHHSGETENA